MPAIRLTLPLMAAAMLGLGAPVAAAPFGPPHAVPWSGRAMNAEMRLEAEFRQLARQFEMAARAGRIDRRSAARIDQRLREIDRLGSRYARNGFNRGERQRIERLLRETRAELRYAMRDNRWRDARWDDQRRGW